MNKIEDWTNANNGPMELKEDWWNRVEYTAELADAGCMILIRHKDDGVIAFSTKEKDRIAEKTKDFIRPVVNW